MKTTINNFRHGVLIKLIIPAFLILLPVAAGGGTTIGPAQAAAPLPNSKETTTQVDNDTLAEQYSTLVMRVYFKDIAERDALAYELSPEEIPTTNGYLTVIRDKYLYDNLKARGTRVEIDERMSRILSDPEALDTFYNGYKTVEEMYTFLDQQVAAHPTLAQKVDIGDSWCKTHPGSCTLPSPWNGYDLYVMHITNQAIPGPKPVFWADGNIHAREIATPEVVMRMISWLLDNYNTNADARWLVDYHDIWLMPTVNPDGHHIVEAGGGGSSPYYFRKNGDNVGGGSCSWPPNAFDHFGVDNNRNFPFKWGCCNGSSGLPCEQTYRGTAANSEEETAAIVAKIRTLIPDQRGPLDTDPAPITTTGLYQNIHTVAGINLYPWGWTFDLMPNYAETDNIARRISSPGQGGNNYTYGCITCELYPVDGGSIDWSYGELGIASISTELGGDDFLIAYSCIDNPGCGTPLGLWPENKGMLIELAKLARTPYLLSHGPDPNLVTTNPMTVTVGSTSQLTSTIKFNWTASDGAPNAFSQNVGAAEYYVDTPPWAGGTPIAMAASDGSFNSPQEGVQATIDTSALAPGRHIIFVRGRGQNDFAGYQTWGIFSAAFLDVVPSGGPTFTPTSTATAVPATSTNTAVPPTSTPTEVPATATSTVEPTATACTIQFTDVPEGSTFYDFIRCMACRGIINGYDSGCETGNPCFRPSNDVTRGQLAKIVSNSAGFVEPAGAQQFEDVLPGSTFYDFVWRLASREIVSGYACGGAGEPCVAPGNLPYFRPNNNVTRGQMSKIVSEAAGFNDTPSGQQFQDVLFGSTFYVWIWRLTDREIMSGYACGGEGEPCIGPNFRPYFRPGANATRGQASKIVSNTFFPNCVTPFKK